MMKGELYYNTSKDYKHPSPYVLELLEKMKYLHFFLFTKSSKGYDTHRTDYEG